MSKGLLLVVSSILVGFFGATVLCAEESTEEKMQASQESAVMENAMIEASSLEATAAASAVEQATASVAPPDVKPPEWVWGEVTSVDKEKGQFEIKHLDYETYEEVTKTVGVDEKTLFENASALGDLKAGDKVTIDYKIKSGAPIAELVVLERDKTQMSSDAMEMPAVKEEAVPTNIPQAAMDTTATKTE